jgi:hypothetical protein
VANFPAANPAIKLNKFAKNPYNVTESKNQKANNAKLTARLASLLFLNS